MARLNLIWKTMEKSAGTLRLVAAPHLPDLERLAMEQVWERGEATVRDVLDSLNAGRPEAPRAYTTVLTIMQRLEAKGMVERRRREKRDVYRAAIGREQYLGRRIDAEVSRLVEDFGELALMQFARRVEELDPERREALRRLSDS
jgi:predicted transcriptional regulator